MTNTNGSLLFLLCTRNLPGNPYGFTARNIQASKIPICLLNSLGLVRKASPYKKQLHRCSVNKICTGDLPGNPKIGIA